MILLDGKVSVSTIGFTQSTAERFFDRLEKADVKTVIDVRLHNTSQLAAFAKADDLTFFLERIGRIRYVHQPLLAPTDEMLKTYKKEKGNWNVYEGRFLKLMEERKIEHRLTPEIFEGACLLCSEALPHHCHRRLVCEYLNDKWNNALSVHHL
jgi:uncharacterized protein (DUF488 family)